MNYLPQIKKRGFVIFDKVKIHGPLYESVTRNGKIVGYTAYHTLHGVTRLGIVCTERLLRV